MKVSGDYTERDWFGKVCVDGVVLDPRPSQAIVNHSPDGFAWSYCGSGPAQLALALLLHAGAPRDHAIAAHHTFMNEVIASLPRDRFDVDLDMQRWLP